VESCPGTRSGKHILAGGWCPFCGSVYYYPGWGPPNLAAARRYLDSNPNEADEDGYLPEITVYLTTD